MPANEPKTKKPKIFDFSKHSCRPIALKIAYFGYNYHGLESQESDTVETIESKLFQALLTTKLIPSRKGCKWSKCGRTDKGVSSFDQILGLFIRSKLPLNTPGTFSFSDLTDPEKLNSYDSVLDLVDEEFEYCQMLNNLLPPDIRVLGWSPVSSSFDARFGCLFRHYNYFFDPRDYNIELMQQAAVKYVGSHDFRNFCKVDPSKPENMTFVRTILESKIVLLDKGIAVFDIKGTAFLWHQVRCLVAILFLVGKELESPDLVDQLFDLSLHGDSGRPTYDMAPDYPLVLVECGYPEGTFNWQSFNQGATFQKSVETLIKMQQELSIKHAQLSIFLGIMGSVEAGQDKKYVPVMSRTRCDSLMECKRKSAKSKEMMK